MIHAHYDRPGQVQCWGWKPVRNIDTDLDLSFVQKIRLFFLLPSLRQCCFLPLLLRRVLPIDWSGNGGCCLSRARSLFLSGQFADRRSGGVVVYTREMESDHKHAHTRAYCPSPIVFLARFCRTYASWMSCRTESERERTRVRFFLRQCPRLNEWIIKISTVITRVYAYLQWTSWFDCVIMRGGEGKYIRGAGNVCCLGRDHVCAARRWQKRQER